MYFITNILALFCGEIKGELDTINGFDAQNVDSFIVDSGQYDDENDNDEEDIPCDDIDSLDAVTLCLSNPMEITVIQWIVIGGTIFLLCCCCSICGWCLCCRRKEDKEFGGMRFMNNPSRYDSEFPGAEMQLFDPKKDNTVQHVQFVE